MKKIVLTRLRNIKTLSKQDFELYASRVPLIIESIVDQLKQSLSDTEDFSGSRQRTFQFVRNFLETGDCLAALSLLIQVEEEIGDAFDTDTRIVTWSVVAYLFTVAGMEPQGEEWLNRVLGISGAELTSCYMFNMLTQSILAQRSGRYDVAAGTARRALEYLATRDLDDDLLPMLPLDPAAIQYLLTKVHVAGVLAVAEGLSPGTRKRRAILSGAESLLDRLEELPQARYRLYGLCERALVHAEGGHFQKCEQDLAHAHQVLNRSKSFFSSYSYYFYATRAYVHSCRNHFSEAYMDARLAFRASFNTPDVFMELDVMESFLKVARRFSLSFPENRKDTSEFYMQGNSLLRQFVEFLEEKDWYTGRKHSKRVAALSYLIGQKIHTLFPFLRSQLDLQTLYLSAFVHDIGKLKLPWVLINKIGRLTPWERHYVCRHVVFSKRILEELNFRDIARIVGQHHENLDGSGYPEGTRNVSIAANIINLADSFEAMTSANRRYKQQKGLAESREELISLGGRIYFPEIIEAFRIVDLNQVDVFTRS